MLRGMVVALVLFGLTSSADAMTVIFKNYKAPKTDYEATIYKVYFDGVREGIIAQNEEMIFVGQQPRFCLPRNLALTVEQADDIMRREAATVTLSA